MNIKELKPYQRYSIIVSKQHVMGIFLRSGLLGLWGLFHIEVTVNDRDEGTSYTTKKVVRVRPRNILSTWDSAFTHE